MTGFGQIGDIADEVLAGLMAVSGDRIIRRLQACGRQLLPGFGAGVIVESEMCK
jgi:hypothetical protein